MWEVSYWGEQQWWSIPTGNYLRGVSYWGDTQWLFFPTGNLPTGDFSTPLPTLEMTGRRGSTVSHTSRKGFAKGFLLWWYALVEHADRKLFANSFLLRWTQWISIPAGNCLQRVSYCGDTQWLIIPAGNFIPVRFDSDSLSFSTAWRQ